LLPNLSPSLWITQLSEAGFRVYFAGCSFDEFDELKLGRKSYSLGPTLASLGRGARSKIITRSSYASSLLDDFEVEYVTDQLTTAERGRTNEDIIQST